MKNLRTIIALTIAAVLALMLGGCAQRGGLAEAEIAAGGNAKYEIFCPVILPGGQVATFTDENGRVQPVMAKATAASGRSVGGDVNVDAPGCISIDIKGGVVQGEARPGLLQTGGDAVGALWRALIGGQ